MIKSLKAASISNIMSTNLRLCANDSQQKMTWMGVFNKSLLTALENTLSALKS